MPAPANPTRPFYCEIDMNGNKIVNLATPTSAADTVNVTYMNTMAPLGATFSYQFDSATAAPPDT